MLTLLLLAFSSIAAGPDPGDLGFNFNSIHSEKIQILDENSPYWIEEPALYPAWASFLQSSFLKYDPDLKRKILSKDCQTGQEQPAAYLKKCEQELQSGQNDIFSNTYKTMMLRLEPRQYPHGRFLLFQLPNGIRLKAFLALKGDQKKRPLVVFRLGIFSNVAEFLPERYFFMQLFEQSPFNMLLLESMSSPEFIRRNKRVLFGGYDEGIQNIQVARLIQNHKSGFAELIDSVHLMAVSLGGHGVLFSSVLNNLSKDKPIRSFTSFCPLINFRDTFDYHMSQGVVKSAIEYWARARLQSIPDVIEGVDKDNFLSSLLTHMEKHYKGGASLDAEVDLPKEMRGFPENYWKLNNYWPFFKEIKSPVLILATEKDPIVPYALNGGRLVGGYTEVGGSNVTSYGLKEGFHCSLPGAYDWFSFSDFLQKYILSLSPGLKFQSHHMSFPVADKNMRLVEWVPQAIVGKNKLLIKAWLSSSGEKSIWQYLGKDWQGFEIPLTDLEYYHPAPIINDSDARMLERWALQNIEFKLEQGILQATWKTLQ